MIDHISIKNFAIIENTDVDFYSGLNMITGETGSGKSVAIEAVSLALGSRADSSYVRTGKDKAVVQLSGTRDGEEFVITREISASGKNLCRINGEVVTLAQVRRLAAAIADIHGQYDNQSLLNPDYHIVLLDAYKHDLTDALRQSVARCHAEYVKARKELAGLLSMEKENLQRLDFYKFELKEIEGAALVPGEDEELAEKVSLLQNSEHIYESVSKAYALLYGESPSAAEGLSSGIRSIEEASSFSRRLSELAEELSDVYYRLEEACRGLRDIRDSITFSPAELDEALARLDLIDSLKKKYGPDIEAVLAHGEKLKKLLSAVENMEGAKKEAAQALKAAKEKLSAACAALTAARKEKTLELAASIQAELCDLNFKDARVEISVEPLAEPTENGADKVEILIATNKGEPLRPLYKIASGGETSRIMLAFKNIISAYDGIPTLIFDEIDSGISGVTASIVGKKLKEISRHHQIICITHLPQIAACGEHNYRIHKESDESSTYAFIEALDEEEKVNEIARLLSGTSLTQSAVEAARELIRSQQNCS